MYRGGKNKTQRRLKLLKKWYVFHYFLDFYICKLNLTLHRVVTLRPMVLTMQRIIIINYTHLYSTGSQAALSTLTRWGGSSWRSKQEKPLDLMVSAPDSSETVWGERTQRPRETNHFSLWLQLMQIMNWMVTVWCGSQQGSFKSSPPSSSSWTPQPPNTTQTAAVSRSFHTLGCVFERNKQEYREVITDFIWRSHPNTGSVYPSKLCQNTKVASITEETELRWR